MLSFILCGNVNAELNDVKELALSIKHFGQDCNGEKFDKEGEYVKKWVPELKNISKKFIHKPWELKDEKNFKLGKNYPFPLVNHEMAREKALNAFKKI